MGMFEEIRRGKISLAAERQHGEENRVDSRRVGLVGRNRSDSDATAKVVSQGCGERTNRVTEDRINTGDFTRLLDRSLVLKKHREHALRALSSATLGSLPGGDQRPVETATECGHQGVGVCTVEDPASGRASAFTADSKVRAGQ